MYYLCVSSPPHPPCPHFHPHPPPPHPSPLPLPSLPPPLPSPSPPPPISFPPSPGTNIHRSFWFCQRKLSMSRIIIEAPVCSLEN